jgi:hypothetical protein
MLFLSWNLGSHDIKYKYTNEYKLHELQNNLNVVDQSWTR